MYFTGTIGSLVLLACTVAIAQPVNYGADVSFPIHHPFTEANRDGPLGDRLTPYEEFMQGCRDHYKGTKSERCDEGEKERLAMSLRQPMSMKNYTSTGFMKIRAPEAVRKLLTDYWKKNQAKQKLENWPAGSIYVNHWKSPSYMVSVEDNNLRGGGLKLKNEIWDAAKTTLEQWSGMELKPTSMYGIRVYTDGAVLNPHVDRLPLVSSCIVNVAQDLDEPWPLEVYDREGNAVNVTMEPGDMVLYESHSLIHGRPFPLKGRFFANIFIHFEPTGRPLYHHNDDFMADLDDFLPPYILPDSPEVPTWKQSNPHGWKMPSPSAAHVSQPEGHTAAALGDVERMAQLAKNDRKKLVYKDRNGWQPIHEAARAGHVEIIKLLLDHNVDLNARTHDGKGGSPLNVAVNSLGTKHPVAEYLTSIGALNIEPEL
jgi:prolyl 4-hydroxylase